MGQGTFWGIALWSFMVLLGMSSLWNFENTPGRSAESPAHWPSESAIKRSADRPTLVTFLHPLCPCSRNSLQELEHIVARLKDTVSYKIVFFSPGSKDDHWYQGVLWEKTQSIPFVEAIVDRDGAESKIFRAETSGHTALYGSDGKLLFSGGVTPSRGHSGDNVGRSSIIDIVEGGSSQTNRSFVFGCDIFGSNQKGVAQ